MNVCAMCLVAQSYPQPLRPYKLQPRLLCPWDSPGKNTGVGSHFFLQGIFPTQGSNPGLLYCRQTLYWLSYAGSAMNNLNLITSKHQTNVKQEAFYKWRKEESKAGRKEGLVCTAQKCHCHKRKKELLQIKDIQRHITIQLNARFGTFFC